jgi:hypothetical protein
MSEVVGERRFIPPNERLKSDFIDLVTDCRRREPLSPKIKVWIDEYNSCVAEIEEELRRDFGCSEIEALLIIFNALMVTESGMKAADELIKTVEAQAKEDELSFNDVDAFELAEVIDEVRDNFPLI